MIVYEETSKMVLGLGPPDPAFIVRGEQNFMRFASVLDEWLKGREWLTGEALTIADFSVAGLVPSAERVQLPVLGYPEIRRGTDGLHLCRPGAPLWLQRTQQWPLGKPHAAETVDLERRTANSRPSRTFRKRSFAHLLSGPTKRLGELHAHRPPSDTRFRAHGTGHSRDRTDASPCRIALTRSTPSAACRNSTPPIDRVLPGAPVPAGISRRSSTSPVSGSMRRTSLASPCQVPCQSSPSTQVTPVTKRSDSMVRSTAPVSGST